MTLLVALLGLMLLIVIHELGHMLTAKALGVRVTEFGIFFGPAIFKRKIGETVYSLRVIPLGGFAKMAGMNAAGTVEEEDAEKGPGTYNSKPPWRRALIIFAGPFANIVTAILIFAGLFMTGVPSDSTRIQAVEPGSLAAKASLQQGDRIISVDGKRTGNWERFIGVVSRQQPGDRVTLIVERGGETEKVSGKLTTNPEYPGLPMVGVTRSMESYGPLESLGLAVEQTASITAGLGLFIGELVTGERSFYDNVSGPVGIASVGSTAVSQGFFPLLLAAISLQLALLNLLPILPLDGGHLLFIAAEKVLGRPVSPETMTKFAALGVALVLALFLFATYADLSKIFTGQPFIPQ